ncbi:DNA polymerase III subunit gamma/tau [Gloeobacter violaceus]|uniref:DNA polymerase III subunit gamma/tau n=1 Tax=Gloeobacter violaceus (strain ATCC 29082 / PCC 7421) TaxID=251221 RepID=Q7NK69_GLOVI|nr:DNA polymerase III subunit gamma/tau [Gloeobacter violaceus]BAC89550.1 DNA polymerase III gamma and tau subunits [Gloeobacter violaceus PCC 7421]
MAYEPLHHKYRPQRFGDVVGQGPIVTTLTNALKAGRIAHAYLFTGSRGTGKTTTARLIAKALNCIHGPTPDPCGRCEQCLAIATGSALDVIEIDAASNTGVDNIRELIERAQFAPVQSRQKVYILDEVHMLSSAAFNCLLKTLEEPPAHVTFVLATTDPQKVLPTVISRCQRFDFRRIPLTDMVKHLEEIAWKEDIDIEHEAVELVAQIAQGGLRDAESLLDQLALLEGTIGAERIWQLVGAVPERELLVIGECIQAGDSTRLIEQVRRLLDSGKEPLQVLQDLLGFYRDLLIAHTAPDRRDLVAVTAASWQQMCERAKTLSIPQLLALQERLRQAEPQIKTSTQPRLWLEVGLLGLLASPSQNQPVALAPAAARPAAPVPVPPPRPAEERPTPPPPAAPRGVEERPNSVPQPPVEPTPPQRPQVPPPSIEPAAAIHRPARPSGSTPDGTGLRERWPEWIRLIPQPTQSLMSSSFWLEETPKRLVIGFTTEPLVKRASEPRRLKQIQEVLQQFLGRPIEVQFHIGKAPAAAPAVAVASSQSAAYTPPPVSFSPPAPPEVTPVSPTTVAPPSAAKPPLSDEEPDELDRAARGLAEFFNGEVISFDGEAEELPGATQPGAAEVSDIDDDEDIPF